MPPTSQNERHSAETSRQKLSSERVEGVHLPEDAASYFRPRPGADDLIGFRRTHRPRADAASDAKASDPRDLP
jgi:hypothetical protein